MLLAACLAQQPRLAACSTSRRRTSTSTSSSIASRCCGEETYARRRVSRGHARSEPRADVLHRLLILADRTIAHDIPAAAALDRPEWLALFSPRLTVGRTAAGQP